VLSIGQLTREHGHQAFYAVEDTGGIIVDVNQNLHMFSVNDVIDSHKHRMNSVTTDASKCDLYERDEIDLTRLAVESRLTQKMRDAIRTRYDHDPLFYDYPWPVIFMMALAICNASQSYYIEGAQKNLDELTLDSYAVEDVTACTAFAQKQFKVVQTGYTPPFRSGSKLLLKFCGTECEQFNRQVYAKLDLVKKFENKYKLADPKSITTNTYYNTYGPIALIASLQEDHMDFVTDHEWPALATKLPQSNNALITGAQPSSDKRPDTRTCYKCHTVGHIAPDCPQKNGKSRNANGEAKTNAANAEPSNQYEYKPMASWKYIDPKDITKAHTGEYGKEWKFCTHFTCRATNKKDILHLFFSIVSIRAIGKQKRQKQILPQLKIIQVKKISWTSTAHHS
jgi:hypothetical protein